MDTRKKNIRWKVTDEVGKVPDWEHVTAALLMDIRDELQALVGIFKCAHFQDIPWKLDKLVANTKKQPRKRLAASS